MTCIVGVVENNKVYIGGDSAGIAGYNLTVRKDKKVFRNGDFIVGGTSSFRMIQLLRYAFEPPHYDENTDLEKYMATTFVDSVRERFKRGGYAQVESQQESGGHFLIGFRGWLFRVEADYQVGEALSSYDAVGCGADIALGCLYATPDMQSHKRIELALRAAEAHNAGVRAPFSIEHL